MFRQHTDNKIDAYTKMQSNLLKRVNLRLKGLVDGHPNMFATAVDFKRGEYQDPCSGDGGGPLMTYDEPKIKNGRERWYILGK